nr:MAG: putative coat protein [Leviviridae sp.]
MPQLQNLVLTDRTPVTPVAHTFTPRDITSDGVGHVGSSSGTPIGEQRASVSMKKRGNRYKGEFRLVRPVVVTETINGVSVPSVSRTAYATLTVDFDERSTTQERDDMLGMVRTALDTGKVLTEGAFKNLEGVY